MIDNVYIKMSQRATEIQEAWKPKDGDVVCDSGGIIGIISRHDDRSIQLTRWKRFERYPLSEVVWLPRIEDLIEIHRNQLKVRGDLKTYLQFASWFDDNVWDKLVEDEPISVPTHDLTTIWLVFVMETCYQKQWNTNEERWVEL